MKLQVIKIQVPAIFILIIISVNSYSQNDKSHKVFKSTHLVYNLPLNKNGLSESSFEVTPSIYIERWENKAEIHLSIKSTMGTLSNPLPSFKQSYNYNGIQYGNQHVGPDPFRSIRLYYVKYEVRVVYGEKFWESTNMGDINNIFGPIDKDANASEVFVEVRRVTNVAFTYTHIIENKIREYLKNKEISSTSAGGKNENSGSSLLNTEKSKSTSTPEKKSETVPQNISTTGNAKATTSEQQKNKVQDNKTRGGQINNSSYSDGDFWETGKKTNDGQSTNDYTNGVDRSKLPEFFRTTDGKYYHKQGDDIQEVDYDQYMYLKHQRANEKKTPTQPQLSAAERQKIIDDGFSKISADQQKQYEIQQEINRKFDLQGQTMIAGRQVGEAKEQLEENSKLQETYESVDQLMADYNEKLNNVEIMVEQLSAQRQQQVNAMANQISYDSNPNTAQYSQAMGDITKLIGGVVAYKKEQKEREMAYNELHRQKKEAMDQIEREKKRLLTNARNDLFQRFKDGTIPNSSTKLDTDSIFYFGYYIPADLGVSNATMEVTTLYPLYRHGDGTWPFREKIFKSVFVNQSSPGILHGYYKNRAEAEAMRQAFINVYTRTGGTVKQIILKTKPAQLQNSYANDFWGTGSSSPTQKNTKQPNSMTNTNNDFWSK